jgi:DNA topoisomerase-1
MSDVTTITNQNAHSYAAQEMARRQGAQSAYNEAQHPRDENGQWADSGRTKQSTMRESITANGMRLAADGGLLPQHIESLKLPPAWTNVRYNADPNADLLAVGKDSKGRDQYVYSQDFANRQAQAKFNRISELADKFTDIQAQNMEARAHQDPKIRDSADVAHLIMQTGLRPGSDTDTKAEKKAYGATTLEGRHVVQDDQGNVRLQFTGKKGVSLDIPIEDKQTAQMLINRAQKAGPDAKIFPNTSDKALLDHVHTLDGGGFKTKDFRTHVGTSTAQAEMEKMPLPTNEKQYKKQVLAVAKEVSKRLGNTPTIALQSYINPAVFSKWRESHA